MRSPHAGSHRRSSGRVAAGVAALLLAGPALAPGVAPGVAPEGQPAFEFAAQHLPSHGLAAQSLGAAEAAEDRAIMARYRPGYRFWEHIFDIPDGRVAYGSAIDGRLLATFPARGDWVREVQWAPAAFEPDIRSAFFGVSLDRGLSTRRDEVAEILTRALGEPVVHNATRGTFVRPNTRRYGSFLNEWAAIYERFGVPGDLGLAQAMVESGWNPTVRSEAGALGLCQWMERNWNFMKRLSPHEIEGHNQTTQAMYCAAYLRILATKYSSFIPALSEHHAGGTNVGRTVINGAWLGGETVREQYFLGAQFAVDLRGISSSRFRDVVRTYGPRSFLYAEMIFGNEEHVARIRSEQRQDRIHAMRTTRSISLDEVARRSGLSHDEIRRYNPALLRQVPARATLYLPMHIDDLGRDVAFWHRSADPEFLRVMREFVAIDLAPERWHDASHRNTLADFRRRFAGSGSEEGVVMATVLGYVMDELFAGRQGEILAEYRRDPRVQALLSEGLREIELLRENSTTVR
jgi:hypothetical protein